MNSLVVAVDWHLIWQRIFHPGNVFWHALWVTVYVSVISQALGVLLGLLAALMRMSGFAPFRWLSGIYAWIFRGTPLLVQIFFIYVTFNLPAINLHFWTISSEALTGIVALSINEGAYMREIIRAGIDSIDRGQMEAARSLGMRYGLAMRRIILPQALKRMTPALTNRAIEIFKMSTLASAVAYVELLQQGKLIASINYNPIEAYTAVAVIFFVFLWPLVQFTYLLERRLRRDE